MLRQTGRNRPLQRSPVDMCRGALVPSAAKQHRSVRLDSQIARRDLPGSRFRSFTSLIACGRCQMAEGIQRYRMRASVLALLVLCGVLSLASQVRGQSAETPRRGGVLLAVIGADPPSLDPHQESTFAN